MHIGNRQFLNDMLVTNSNYFNNSKVLELGSLDINGTARDSFSNCEFVGIDKFPGKCVDIVIEAKNTVFTPNYFDVLISMSMFEHDPDWKISLSHNLQWLRSNGFVMLSWGAEGNKHHEPEPWALVPINDVFNLAKTLPLKNIDVFFERDRYHPDCDGCCNMTAFKL